MWLWPLARFWTYSPLGFACAVVWNACEMCHVRMPFAPWAFGKIVGAKRANHD
jgi:hypothetical protein